MSNKPRQKHLSKVWTKNDGKYAKKHNKPWSKREQIDNDIFANLDMSDIWKGFKNKTISVRDCQYRQRME